MKKIKIAVVGYGNRGQVYADYSLEEPNEVEVAAVIDPNEYKLQVAKQRYGLTDGQLFMAYADFVAAGVQVDIVINATMEQHHYQTAMEILRSKQHMLIEKPIVAKRAQLMEIQRTAKENGCMVFVCHVLRYSPFYKAVKNMIADGTLGDIISMEMNEHVWIPHFVGSYGRGKWNKESVCGSPILLAKCCHDMDLICWLNSASKPNQVACFGHRKHFVKANKPKGAAAYCFDCPHEKECPYSAVAMHYELDSMPFLTWDSLNKPYDKITKEEKEAFLRKDIYGQCIYDIDGDVMDRQNLIVDFADGSVVTFTLSCGTCRPDRFIHVVGTKGEVEGKLEENKFIHRTYNSRGMCYREEIVDVSKQIVNKARYGGHSGGDYGIMHDLVRYLNGESTLTSITFLDDSVASHLLVYAAEESRKNKQFVTV